MSPNPDISKNVLNKISAGSVEMHSRTYFTLRTLGIAVAAVTTLVIALFVVSFHLFSLQEAGEPALLGFGTDGFLTFASLFPILPALFILALLVVLERALREYTSAYRLSIIRLFGVLTVGVVMGSSLIALTPLHRSLLDAADRDQLPILAPFYEQVHGSRMMHGIYRGSVIDVGTSTFTIAHNDGDRDTDVGTWVVSPPPAFSLTDIVIGEKVFVAGRVEGGAVRAFGVHRMTRMPMMK